MNIMLCSQISTQIEILKNATSHISISASNQTLGIYNSENGFVYDTNINDLLRFGPILF